MENVGLTKHSKSTGNKEMVTHYRNKPKILHTVGVCWVFVFFKPELSLSSWSVTALTTINIWVSITRNTASIF